MKNHNKRRFSITTLVIGGLIGAAIFGAVTLLNTKTETVKSPVRVSSHRQIENLNVETETTKRTSRQTDFLAWCNYTYTDGSTEKKFLGRFSIFGNVPENFGFASDKCDNLNR